MFLFHVLGLSFEGVRDSLLLHICFCCVWCLAHNLLSVQLVSCACILWIRCLLCSSSSFILCFCSCGVFVMGSGLFLVNSCRHLGIVFPWLLCPDVVSSTSCLGCSFVCGWVFGLPFGGNFPGGSYGYGQPGGVNIFFGFSHNRGVWVKTAAALGEECFFKVAFFEKPASKRWKRTPVFNFVAGNAIKIGVPELFSWKKSDPRLFTFLIF